MDCGSFNYPDETRIFPHGEVAVVNVGDRTVMCARFEPGWSWSGSVKPLAGTESCEVAHFMVVTSGQLVVTMDDGTTQLFKAGDAAYIPPGHDAYVSGDETFVSYDFGDIANYARRP